VDSELNNIQILSPEEYKERKEKSKTTKELPFLYKSTWDLLYFIQKTLR
jgi:hypothetical protein